MNEWIKSRIFSRTDTKNKDKSIESFFIHVKLSPYSLSPCCEKENGEE